MALCSSTSRRAKRRRQTGAAFADGSVALESPGNHGDDEVFALVKVRQRLSDRKVGGWDG